MKNNILVTRFGHGAGGKFLSTILQTSDCVGHWSYVVQDNKKSDLINKLHIEYVKRTLIQNYKDHLSNEPMVPYNTDFYSSSLPRGNEITYKQFCEYLKDDIYFKRDNNKHLFNLIFSKNILPVFCNGSKVITVTHESKAEQDWLYETLWNKHFYETENEIRYIPYDPELCNFKSLPLVLKYNNKYKFKKTDKNIIIEKYIKNNPNVLPFANQSDINVDNIDNYFFKLKWLLNKESFIVEIEKVFNYFKLSNFDIKLLKEMHSIWLQHQVVYKNKHDLNV